MKLFNLHTISWTQKQNIKKKNENVHLQLEEPLHPIQEDLKQWDKVLSSVDLAPLPMLFFVTTRSIKKQVTSLQVNLLLGKITTSNLNVSFEWQIVS